LFCSCLFHLNIQPELVICNAKAALLLFLLLIILIFRLLGLRTRFLMQGKIDLKSNSVSRRLHPLNTIRNFQFWGLCGQGLKFLKVSIGNPQGGEPITCK
jgi:hypothetical protein